MEWSIGWYPMHEYSIFLIRETAEFFFKLATFLASVAKIFALGSLQKWI
jgi:L-rhamnose mutarotase